MPGPRPRGLARPFYAWLHVIETGFTPNCYRLTTHRLVEHVRGTGAHFAGTHGVLIRYRTGQVVQAAAALQVAIFCGLAQVVGRVGWMLTIRGVNVFPSTLRPDCPADSWDSGVPSDSRSRRTPLDRLQLEIEAESDPASVAVGKAVLHSTRAPHCGSCHWSLPRSELKSPPLDRRTLLTEQ